MPAGAHDLTAQLVAWLGELCPDVDVRVRGLRDSERGQGLDVRLIGVQPLSGALAPGRAPAIALDYLVTADLEEPLAGHRVLGEFAFAARRPGVFALQAETGVDACVRLGLPPAPGFVLRGTLERDVPSQPVRRVRFPVVVRADELKSLQGRVLGPDDTPVAGAAVAVRGGREVARTDREGAFRLAAPSGGAGPVRLSARARGVEVEAEGPIDQPIILRLPLET